MSQSTQCSCCTQTLSHLDHFISGPISSGHRDGKWGTSVNCIWAQRAIKRATVKEELGWRSSWRRVIHTEWNNKADRHNGLARYFNQWEGKTTTVTNFAQHSGKVSEWREAGRGLREEAHRYKCNGQLIPHTHPLGVTVPLYLIGLFNRRWLAIASLLNGLARANTTTKTNKQTNEKRKQDISFISPQTMWQPHRPEDLNSTLMTFSESRTFRLTEAITLRNIVEQH